jgi:hypothetical protein
VKCIAWNFDGTSFVEWDYELDKLRFENKQSIPNVDSYFNLNGIYL